MDSEGSDNDQLPLPIDSDVEQLISENTTSSFRSSQPAASSSRPQTPTSPGHARKRTNDEVYAKIEKKHTITDPTRSPKSIRGKSYLDSTVEPASPTQFAASGFKSIPIRASVQPPATMNPFGNNGPVNTVTVDDTQLSRDFFTIEVEQFEKQLQTQYIDYDKSIRDSADNVELNDLDWQDLEDRYSKAMQPQVAAEQQIMDDFAARFQQFQLWMQIASQREAERGVKRLRTKIAYVQNSEDQLSQRQEHYNKVLDAFQNAMALLGNL